MYRLRRLFLLAVITATAVACGTPDKPDKDGADSGVIHIGQSDMGTPDSSAPFEVTSGSVTINVVDAFEVSTVGGSRPSAGNTVALVSVAIANGLDEAIPVSFNLFRLRVDQLERLPSPATAELQAACPDDSLLSAGMIVDCAVAFEIPTGAEPAALIFQSPAGAVESPLTYRTCTRCEGACADLQSSEAHCGRCGNEVPSGGTCEAGEPSCPDGEFECDGACQRDTTQCFVSSTRRASCSLICGEDNLRCDHVEYFYQCTENMLDVHPDLGCDDMPPANMDGCGPYSDMDCRCLP